MLVDGNLVKVDAVNAGRVLSNDDFEVRVVGGDRSEHDMLFDVHRGGDEDEARGDTSTAPCEGEGRSVREKNSDTHTYIYHSIGTARLYRM